MILVMLTHVPRHKGSVSQSVFLGDITRNGEKWRLQREIFSIVEVFVREKLVTIWTRF